MKEYGLQTSLLVSHFIRWKSIKKNTYFTSPLIYRPISIKKNQKIRLKFDYNLIDEQHFVNPIIQNEFIKLFNVKLNLENNDIDSFLTELKTNLEVNGDIINFTDSWDDTNEWQIITSNAIGTFNYKKSVLGKDYDTIIKAPNQSVNSILGETTNEHKEPKEKLNLSYSDASQQDAINYAFNNNLVIEGPPGTGKSHTIVELLKQNLLANKRVLFVSEKKSALDVVYNKLKSEKLDHLVAYFNSDKSQKKEFYKQLKLNIDNKITSDFNPSQLEFRINELENYFDSYSNKLTETNKNLDGTLYDSITYLSENQVEDLEYNVRTNIPNSKTWFNYYEFLEDMEEISVTDFKLNSITNLPFIELNKSVFLEKDPLSKIEIRLKELETWVLEIKRTLTSFNLNWSWSELAKFTLAASVLNMANKSQLDILDPSSKNYKSFDKWTKKYELTQNKLKLSNEICSKWIIKPKLADIDALIQEASQNKSKSWLSLFKQSRLNKVFKSYKDSLSVSLRIPALNNLKENYLLKSLLDELEIKLKHNLHILNPETDINHLLHLRQKLDTLSSNQYVYLLEHNKSLLLIQALHQLQPKIQKCNQIIKFLFVDLKIDSINEFNNHIKKIRVHSAKFKFYLPEIKKTLNLPNEMLLFIKSYESSIEHLTNIVVYHNYLEQIRFEPTLKNLESIDILSNYKTLKRLKIDKNQLLRHTIYHKWIENRRKIENLLTTPASKLTKEEKNEKQRQKASKRVIFHEIAKKQQHLSIKSLVNQTNYSIFDLLPIWIMNPLTIAENLPCDPDIFDVIIFDESSQIPLEDSIPAIYRSKKVIVVGDSKQMPPSQFFSSSKESLTLLNQADSVFKSKLLTWHYRSEHPNLMQFSNNHFYDNELCYFPAVSNANPIELIKVKDGIFEDGKNRIEATCIASKYKDLINQNITSIAIIAFSKEQEKLIETEISKLNLPNNEVLLLRNLENSQGIERDNVLISIGYGYNKDGDFRMNFGPLNQEYGGNRLNVLLTRAKQKMFVFTSVESTDFKLSQNRGVQLLRDFLAFAEENTNLTIQQPESFIHKMANSYLKDFDVRFYKCIDGLAVNCFIQHSTQKVLLIDPCLNPNENKDIYTILSVLDERFKSMKVLLSHDYWTNKERFESDIVGFFK